VPAPQKAPGFWQNHFFLPTFVKKFVMSAIKSFKDWTQYDLEQQFGLIKKPAENCSVLNEWLNVDTNISDARINAELEDIRVDLAEYADSWNEEELKAFFIFPLLRLVNFKSKKYKLVFERKLSTTLNGVDLKGDVDAMIASGSYNRVVAPFFCLQEYKPEGRKSVGDVRGQLLAEMLAAHVLNKNDNPIFGCYLNGRLWFFATLIGSEYCFSNGFISDDKKDLVFIFNCLRKLKAYIDDMVA
jgi:hypothetical protein